MASRRPIVIPVRIEGVRETLGELNRLPKEASAEVKVKARELSTLLASRIQANARSEGRQAASLARTVKARSDRVPTIQIGGSAAVGHKFPKRGKGKAYELLFGSEFGGRGHGFKAHRGPAGYWAFPVVEQEQAEIAAAWNDAVDAIIRRHGGRA